MRFLASAILALALPFAALAGTTNIPGRLIIQTDDSAPTCSTASGDGMLCVESAVELQSTCSIAGATSIGGAMTVAGATTIGGATTVSYLRNDGADIADTGFVRMSNDQCLAWESDPTGTDQILCVGSDEFLRYNGPIKSVIGTGGRLISQDSTNPGNASGAALLDFMAYSDTADDNLVMGQIAMDVTDATDGAEYADVVLNAMTNGTAATEYLRADASLGIVKLSKGLTHHNGTTLPATCTVGQMFLDTDSDDCSDTGAGDGCLCICKSTDTWAIVINI